MSSKGPIDVLELRSTLEASLFDLLPDEVINIVIGALPAYALGGKKAVHSTCRLFNLKAAGISKDTKVLKREDILNSCVTQQDALNILKDRELCSKLRVGAFLKILNFFPDIKQELLTQELDRISEFALGLHDSSKASEIIERCFSSREKLDLLSAFKFYHPTLECNTLSGRELFTYAYGKVRKPVDPLVEQTQLYDFVLDKINRKEEALATEQSPKRERVIRQA